MNGTLDHVMFAWDDLDEITDIFAQCGLVPDYGGVHGNQPTEMAMLGFEDGSYLELIAPTNPEEPPQGWPEQMFSAGPCRWCLEVEDLNTELIRLEEAGATVREPEKQSRERRDGTVIEYESGAYGTAERGWPFPFLIQDRTPRHYRVQQSESVTTSSLTGIAQVVIAVANIDEIVTQFQQLYSIPSPQVTSCDEFGATLASVPDHPMIFAEPVDDTIWVADRVEQFPGWACAFLLGSSDFTASTTEFPITCQTDWFGSHVGWFDAPELTQRVGVIEQ